MKTAAVNVPDAINIMDYAGTSDLWVVGCSKVFTLGFTNKNFIPLSVVLCT
jgi:hypothetical protein